MGGAGRGGGGHKKRMERKGVLGLQIRDLKKKDSNQEQSRVPEGVLGKHTCPSSPFREPGERPGPSRSPGPGRQQLSEPCRALLPPSPAPGIQREGPAPIRGGDGLGGAGQRGQGPGWAIVQKRRN